MGALLAGQALRVLRLCSVFEPPAEVLERSARFDPIGGMQHHTGQLTRALDDRGVSQTVVTTWLPGTPRSERLGARSAVVRLGLPTRHLRQLYSLPAAWVVPALAARADLVHVHLGEDLAVLPLGVRAARRHRLPVVVTVHCSLRHTLKATTARAAFLRTVGGGIEAWGVRRCDAVVALTPRLAAWLVACGLDARRVHVIPSGVDPRLFADPGPDPVAGLPRPRILFVGRLAPQKGLRTLVDAVPLLRHGSAPVLLVGDGPERGHLERRARRRGVDGRVRFCGFVPHQQVPAYLAHADVLVLPSVYEELGSVLLEAMEAGLPVVASAVGGIPDVVSDGVTGRLVPPGDPAALAAAVDQVLGDPALAGRLGAAAKQLAAGYHWDRLAERVLGVYRAVAAPDVVGAAPA